MATNKLNQNKNSTKSKAAVGSVAKPKTAAKSTVTKPKTAAKKSGKKENIKVEGVKEETKQMKFVPIQKRSLSDIILANLIVLCAMFLSALIPVISFALPFLVMIYLEVGLYGFILNKERGQNYKYEDLFVSLKKYIKIFCVAIIKLFLIAFWSILLIVPGVICALNYCFTSLILYESSDLDVKGALMLSKELARGYRWNIFFYSMLAITSICIAMSLMFFIILIFDTFLNVSATIYMSFVLTAGFLDLVLLALPMIEIAIVDNFILSKQEKTI